MKQPLIIHVGAADMTRDGMAKGLERIAMELSLATQGALFAFEADGAPWESPSVRYWCSRVLLLHKMIAVTHIANEGAYEGVIGGIGMVGVTAAARVLLGGNVIKVPHDIRITRGDVWFRGERFMTFVDGAIQRPESAFKREVRAFCAEIGIEVVSAAHNFDDDGCVIEVVCPTLGAQHWVGTWSRATRHRSRVALRDFITKQEKDHADLERLVQSHP